MVYVPLTKRLSAKVLLTHRATILSVLLLSLDEPLANAFLMVHHFAVADRLYPSVRYVAEANGTLKVHVFAAATFASHLDRRGSRT